MMVERKRRSGGVREGSNEGEREREREIVKEREREGRKQRGKGSEAVRGRSINLPHVCPPHYTAHRAGSVEAPIFRLRRFLWNLQSLARTPLSLIILAGLSYNTISNNSIKIVNRLSRGARAQRQETTLSSSETRDYFIVRGREDEAGIQSEGRAEEVGTGKKLLTVRS